MIMLNETDLLQANGGFIGAAFAAAVKDIDFRPNPCKMVDLIVGNVDGRDHLDLTIE